MPTHHRTVLAAALVLSGCLLGIQHSWLAPAALVLFVLAAALAATSTRFAPAVALLSLSLLYAAQHRAPAPDPLSGLDDQRVAVRGVVDEPVVSSEHSERLVVRVAWLSCTAARTPVAAAPPPASLAGQRVLLRLRSPGPRRWPHRARWGQDVLAVGRLRAPRSSDDFDYAAWLAARDVRHVLEVDGARDLAVVQGRGLGFPLDLAAALRARCEDAINHALPDPSAALLRGIVLGDGHALAAADAEAFRVTGTYHVVAASGLNVTLVMVMVAAVGDWLGLRRPASALLAVGAVVLYALVAGASESIVRAAWMAGIVQVGRVLARPADPLAALSVAVMAMCAADPRVAEDVGFAMSVTCVAGMAILTEPLERRLRRVPRPARAAVAATLACQLAVLPVVAAAFGTVSLVALLANLVVVPICEAALGAGLLLCALPAPLLAVPLQLALSAALSLVHAAAALPWASVAIPAPPPVIAITYWLILAKLCTRRRAPTLRPHLGV